MFFAEVMKKLEGLGTAQNRKIYKRHGASEPMFGVSFANQYKLQKAIKRDHKLALQLWASKNVDAQTLATMIADPEQFDEETIDQWLQSTQYHMLIDVIVGNIVSKTSFAQKKLHNYIKSKDEGIGRAGWRILASLAMYNEDLPDAFFEKFLPLIEVQIHQAKNRTREAMNTALIAIGCRNDDLAKLATAAAKRIGPVEVDHGETSCKTPNAMEYIKKTRDRAKKKLARK
jgi:3-methyladenine DNA glycosylase AlkD